MPRVRILQGVSGLDFSWIPGEEIDMSEEDAVKWADGYRAELVETTAQPRPAETVTERPAPERAARKARGGARGAQPETRD